MGGPAVEVLGGGDTSTIGSGDNVSSVESYDHASISQNSSGVSGTSTMTPATSPPRSAPASAVNSPRSSGDPSRQQQQAVNPFDMQQESGYHYTPDQLHQGYDPSAVGQSHDASEDDQTDPTSSTAGNTGDTTSGYTRSDNYASKTFQKIRKRISSSDRKRSGSGGDDDDMMDAAVIDGYLDKLGRNGKWQTRWFETDGECLTYYKSSKRIKLMATLDLAKVGSIVINDTDPTGCCFTINISERPYHLRAESKAACRDWVITLNRVKEARMQQGNVKLVAANHPPDLLDEHYTPRVVVVANRQRTRAVDDDDIHSWEGGGGAGIETSWSNNHAEGGNHFDTAMTPAYSNRLARWQKPRTSLSRLASKLFKWARSLRKYNCTTDVEHHVVLDHHVHPPGHDDKRKRASTAQNDHVPADGGEVPNNPDSQNSVSHSVQSDEQVDDDDEEPRWLS